MLMSSLIGFVGPSAVSMSLIYPFPRRSPDRALGILLQPEPRPSGVRIRAGEGSLVLNKGLGSKTSPLRGRMVGSVALDRGEAHLKKVRAALTLGIPSSTAETSLYLSSSE